jgi:hypothetical protein
MERVNDKVTIDIIEKWESNDKILITAPTGQGKNYWLKHTLIPYHLNDNKKIIILAPRTTILDQQKQELIEFENMIDFKTYQEIETRINNKENEPLSSYDVVICDEFDYFVRDANFNHDTDLSAKYIFKKLKAQIIGLSATSFMMIKLLTKRKIEFKQINIEPDYSFIDNLYFYDDDKSVNHILDNIIELDEKAIYFCQSAKKAFSVHSLYSDSFYYCSQHNKSYSKNINEKSYDNLIKNNQFNERFMFTTSAMDSGVSIIDDKIKHIIIDMDDKDVLLQCLGRKRLNKDEKINVYIKNIKGNTLNGKIKTLKDKLEMANFLMNKNNTQEDFLSKYSRKNYSDIIYDVSLDENSNKKKVNDVSYFKIRETLRLFELMKKREKNEKGWTNYIADYILGSKPFLKYELTTDKDVLEVYLESKLGIKMFKQEQAEFKKWIDSNVLKTIKKNHGSLGLNTINAYFEEKKIIYKVISKQESSKNSENYNKRFWMIHKLTTNKS